MLPPPWETQVVTVEPLRVPVLWWLSARVGGSVRAEARQVDGVARDAATVRPGAR